MTAINKRNALIGALVLLAIVITYIFALSIYNHNQERQFAVSDYKVIYYNVEKGDTLWQLAKEYKAEDDDVREWVDAVKVLNFTNSSTLTAGTCIKIYVVK